MTKSPADDEFSPECYINRELSWLEFNRRVLEEAEDPTQPLIERVKFLSIFSSNLDEFFEIRVAGIKQQLQSGASDTGPDGLSPADILQGIRQRVSEMLIRQYDLWNKEIRPALAEHKVVFVETEDLNADELAWVDKHFTEEIFPVLTPLAVDPSHPFPQLSSKSHNLIAQLRKPGGQIFHAIVQLPRVLSRLIRVTPQGDDSVEFKFLYLKSLARRHISTLFPGLEVLCCHVFRITRNSDLYIDEEEAENLLRTIEDELRKRNRGNAVRLEVLAGCPEDIVEMLKKTFNLEEDDVYRVHGPPVSFVHLNPLCFSDALPRLKDRPFHPVTHRDLWADDLFGVIRDKDVLLHHPYESFESVVHLLQNAASDPLVMGIKMTLYRTSGDSPVVKALVRAAQNGKQVTALVELKARFDEANNIQWARQLEEAGVHVLYGIVGLKTHSKLLLITRRDDDRIRHYAHLGTGNYHPKTARIYTDLSLLTTNPALTAEVASLFNALTGLSEPPSFEKLIVAPFDMADRFIEMIEREAEAARRGGTGRIIVKVNSLVAPDVIGALYRASQAGVKIDLIVRGICCLRPDLPGISENIRVISIVGRFLEHSRIYHFANQGDPLVYLGSADWMPRNLYRRIEVAFPLEDRALKQHVIDEILGAYLNDRVKARELRSDGTYFRLKPEPNQKSEGSQLHFRAFARRMASEQESKNGKSRRLVPARREGGAG